MVYYRKKGRGDPAVLNIGDILFQLFSLLVPICFIAVLVYVVRFSKRVKRMEAKIDEISKKVE
jgi:cbb3-type cytochrome oxidase subunit 3